MKRRILSILLVIVLMFSMVIPAMVTPVEAVGPALGLVASTEGLAVIAWLLASLGITFASNGDMVKSVNRFLQDNPVALEYLNLCKLPASVSTGFLWQPTQADMQYIYKIMIKAKEYFFKDDTNLSNPTLERNMYQNTYVYDSIPEDTFPKSVFLLGSYSSDTWVTFLKNGVSYSYSVHRSTSGNYSMMLNGQAVADDISNPNMPKRPQLISMAGLTDVVCSYGFYIYKHTDGSVWINPFIAAVGVDSKGLLVYKSASNRVLARGAYPLSAEELSEIMQKVRYKRVINFDWSEFQNALQKKINEMTGTIDIPFDQPVSDVVKGKQEVENDVEGKPYVPTIPAMNWAEIWDLLGIKDLIKTLQPVAETDVNVPQLPTSITDKFPFCVPFDLIALVQALNAPPVAPKFTIPLKFPIINYSDNIVLDFSGSDWNKVGSVIRWGNTLIFLVGLILITRKVIQA